MTWSAKSRPVAEHPIRVYASARPSPPQTKGFERRLRAKTGRETIEEVQAWAQGQAWWARTWRGEVYWDRRYWFWMLKPETSP